MKEHILNTKDLPAAAADIHAGDRVLLSGRAYTARDAAHKRLMELLDAGKPLPFPLEGSAIYYVGPTPDSSTVSPAFNGARSSRVTGVVR